LTIEKGIEYIGLYIGECIFFCIVRL